LFNQPIYSVQSIGVEKVAKFCVGIKEAPWEFPVQHEKATVDLLSKILPVQLVSISVLTAPGKIYYSGKWFRTMEIQNHRR
jgi:hypothetical protein